MKKISSLFIFLLFGFAFNVSAQLGGYTITTTLGDLNFLNGVTDLKIEYSYDGMMVGNMTEEDYIIKHAAELNKKKAGTGDEWKIKWVTDREKKFHPAFERYFIKALAKANITASPTKTDAKYTLIIKTLTTEPGLYTGVSVVAKKTYIDVDAIFIETGKPDKELCTIAAKHFIGDAGDFASYDISLRLSSAYLGLGNRLGGYVLKAIK